MATETKSQTLNRLFKENGLIAEDYYQHKHYTIITRSGIEKIQYKNNITIRFDAVMMQPDFCVVKAHAVKPLTKGEVTVETFGSAGHGAKGEADQGKVKTNQYAYYPELAEKRALSRAVLKISNFYELGVFGEDESEEFKKGQATSKPAPEPPLLMVEKAQPVAEAEALENYPPSSENVRYVSPEEKAKNSLLSLLDINIKYMTSIEHVDLRQKVNKMKPSEYSAQEEKLTAFFKKRKQVRENEAIELIELTNKNIAVVGDIVAKQAFNAANTEGLEQVRKAKEHVLAAIEEAEKAQAA